MVAHRAGNDLDALRRAEELGADLVEADVRLFRGRAVVRHLKTIGPIPLYWDRWTLGSPLRRYPSPAELIGQTSDETALMLDLKGSRQRLAQLVLDDVRPYLGTREITVCARWWRQLEPFAEAPVRRIGSARRPRELRALLRRFEELRLDGVSVHEGLVDEAMMADIRRVAELVLTWPANTPTRARELLALGVDGLISDHIDAIVPMVAPR